MNMERIVAYKWLKLIESLVLIIVGIVFACFYNNAGFVQAVGYGFAVILLVYGVIEILGCLLLKRSIFSSEIILGLIIISVSVMLLVYSGKLSQNPQQFNELITWFFGILIIGYSIVLIASGIMEIIPDKAGRRKLALGICELVFAAALIALDVVLWIFGLGQEESNPVLVLIIAIALILMGFIAIGNTVLAVRTQKILEKDPSFTQKKQAAAPQDKAVKAQKETEETKQIETIDATKALPDKKGDSEGK